MATVLKVLLVIAIVLAVLLVVLYFLGRKAQTKQAAQKQQMDAMAQNVTMLVIDKKRMKLKDAGLPAIVLEQVPKLMRNSKMPIVKAKVGPKVTSFICDAMIFDQIPVKKEVKAVISGLYITSVKGMRGNLEKPSKKPGLMARLRKKADKAQADLDAAKQAEKKSKKK